MGQREVDQEYLKRTEELIDGFTQLNKRVFILALDRVYNKDGSINKKLTSYYVPNKYEGRDLTDWGQTTDGVINKANLIKEHYLSEFNAVSYKSATGKVDEKELTDKILLK